MWRWRLRLHHHSGGDFGLRRRHRRSTTPKQPRQGTLTVATDPSYAPNEFFDTDGKTITGMDIDLARTRGGVRGLKVQPTQVVFDSILPGLAAGRYDIGISSFTDTKEREKQVDIARKRREIGMVFQRFNLFPHPTALENIIEAPVRMRAERRSDATQRGRALLARVGLADRADAHPAELSRSTPSWSARCWRCRPWPSTPAAPP
nr:transporter substrate-binding domain-containing protein [Candidatus Frankia alpina]